MDACCTSSAKKKIKEKQKKSVDCMEQKSPGKSKLKSRSNKLKKSPKKSSNLTEKDVQTDEKCKRSCGDDSKRVPKERTVKRKTGQRQQKDTLDQKKVAEAEKSSKPLKKAKNVESNTAPKHRPRTRGSQRKKGPTYENDLYKLEKPTEVKKKSSDFQEIQKEINDNEGGVPATLLEKKIAMKRKESFTLENPLAQKIEKRRKPLETKNVLTKFKEQTNMKFNKQKQPVGDQETAKKPMQQQSNLTRVYNKSIYMGLKPPPTSSKQTLPSFLAAPISKNIRGLPIVTKNNKLQYKDQETLHEDHDASIRTEADSALQTPPTYEERAFPSYTRNISDATSFKQPIATNKTALATPTRREHESPIQEANISPFSPKYVQRQRSPYLRNSSTSGAFECTATNKTVLQMATSREYVSNFQQRNVSPFRPTGVPRLEISHNLQMQRNNSASSIFQQTTTTTNKTALQMASPREYVSNIQQRNVSPFRPTGVSSLEYVQMQRSNSASSTFKCTTATHKPALQMPTPIAIRQHPTATMNSVMATGRENISPIYSNAVSVPDEQISQAIPTTKIINQPMISYLPNNGQEVSALPLPVFEEQINVNFLANEKPEQLIKITEDLFKDENVIKILDTWVQATPEPDNNDIDTLSNGVCKLVKLGLYDTLYKGMLFLCRFINKYRNSEQYCQWHKSYKMIVSCIKIQRWEQNLYEEFQLGEQIQCKKCDF